MLTRLQVNIAKSLGNQLVSSCGTKYLDLFGNIGSLPLGYNHPRIVEEMKKNVDVCLLAQRQALNFFPPDEFIKQMKTVYPRIYNNDNYSLKLTVSGSEAVENAIKLCHHYKYKKEYDNHIPIHHNSSSILNSTPGSSNFKFISFKGGFHGRSIGALACSRSNPKHKWSFPSFNHWPMVPFPRYKYPCEMNEKYNKEEDDVCVYSFREYLNLNKELSVGVIVEPIQCEGGDNHASNSFFQQIRQLCKANDIPFVVDEVQTGLGTGKIFAHEHWNLDEPPDMILFSKKFQSGGIFYHKKFEPIEPYAFNSTWAGDVVSGVRLGAILDEVEKENLLKKSFDIGNLLFKELSVLDGVRNVRHSGSLGAFDVDNRQDVIQRLEQEEQILVGPCGMLDSIRLRPSLTLSENEVEIFLNGLKKVL